MIGRLTEFLIFSAWVWASIAFGVCVLVAIFSAIMAIIPKPPSWMHERGTEQGGTHN